MSEQTKIQWCDSTLNFWEGCTKVSPGCANCYGTRQAAARGRQVQRRG
jgi:protein gp37